LGSIGRFTIVKPLHRAATFHARDGKRHVAIEILPDADVERVRATIEQSSKLEHPNICRVLDLVVEEGQHILVMELIEGVTIADRLMIGAFDPGQASALLEQLLSALACGHAAGFAHGEVSAENVMIDITGKLRLLDFGIARDRRATVRGDLRAVGGLAHSMLTGDTGPVRLAAVPPGYRAWVRRCTTAILPFADAEAAIVALRHLPAEPPSVDIPLVVGSAAVAAAAIALLLVWAARATSSDIVAATPQTTRGGVIDDPLNKNRRPPLPSGAIEPHRLSPAMKLPAPPITLAPTKPLAQVIFPPEAAWLDEDAVYLLEYVVGQLARDPLMRVGLAGHSSAEAKADDAKNKQLALWRANAVRDYLVKRGIDETRIEVTSHGNSQPAFSNDTESGRSQNRRVDIRVLPRARQTP
jgi:outer membrane protein OmpA-like peptidoglycan-associated protein